MNVRDIFVSGVKITLGNRIGRGGEGEVFALQKSEHIAVKIYTLADIGEREQKINAMLSANLSKTSNAIAFPISAAQYADGSFAGFLMPLVSKHRPIHELYAPAPRKRHFPTADFRFLVRVALNLARAIDAVHQAGCVIGDINHDGVLVSLNATTVLIDADSFQFSYADKTFLCNVGVLEFTAPELQGQRLSALKRSKNHDAFALAVLIFQLLFMGRHPFAGTYINGEMSLEASIAQYRFVYSRNRQTGMSVPPGTVTLRDLPNDLAECFERAFDQGGLRPSALEWVEVLKKTEANLVRCSANPTHYFFRTAGQCPWCRIANLSGVELFLAKINIASGPVSYDDSVFQRAIAFVLPPLDSLPAELVRFAPQIIVAPAKSQGESIPALILGIVGFAILIQVPQLWFVAVGFLFFAWKLTQQESEKDVSDFLSELTRIDKNISEGVFRWREDTQLLEAYSIQNEIKQIKQEFESLPIIRAELLLNLKKNRKDRAVLAHLDKHLLRYAKITGIAQSKIRLLSSYGFDTAGDLRRQRVLSVPGIGPVYSGYLEAWVTNIEKSFVPKFSQSDEAVEQALAEKEISRIANELIQEAIQKENRLKSIAGVVFSKLQKTPASLSVLIEQRRVVAGEIIARGQPVSALTVRQSTPPSVNRVRRTFGRPLNPNPQPSPIPLPSSPPNCPKCRQVMLRRVARRGRRQGKAFWGCSAYPICTATLPI